MVVRLFVSGGEGQHAINPRLPDPLSAQPTVSKSCLNACVLAGVTTSALSIIGRHRPATFLRWTAYLNTVSLGTAICNIYASSVVNKEIYKRSGIDRKPFRLWERCESWTMDDVVLAGAAIGLVTALRKKSFPGVNGWKRYFGAITVGAGVSFYVGDHIWSSHPRYQIAQMLRNGLIMQQSEAVAALAQDEDFIASLSPPPVRWLLASLWRSHQAKRPQLQSTLTPNTGPVIVLGVEFERFHLQGPDMDKTGGRAYHQKPEDTGAIVLAEQITHFNQLRIQHAMELSYVRQEIANKEHELYEMSFKDETADVAQRELQLLNAVARTLWLRKAAFEHIVDDFRGRQHQLVQKHAGRLKARVPADFNDDPGYGQPCSPHLATKLIRQHWEHKKMELVLIEQLSKDTNALKHIRGNVKLRSVC